MQIHSLHCNMPLLLSNYATFCLAASSSVARTSSSPMTPLDPGAHSSKQVFKMFMLVRRALLVKPITIMPSTRTALACLILWFPLETDFLTEDKETSTVPASNLRPEILLMAATARSMACSRTLAWATITINMDRFNSPDKNHNHTGGSKIEATFPKVPNILKSRV